jgi:hypothetical protein
MASTALAKAKEQMAAVGKRASAARKELAEVKGTKGSLARMPATLGGAALVGAAQGSGMTAVLGAPVDIAAAIALGAAGIAAGSPMALDAASGAASVAVARYTANAVASFMAARKAPAE